MKKCALPIALLVSVMLNLVLLDRLCQEGGTSVIARDTTIVKRTFAPETAADSIIVEHRDYKIPNSAVKVRGSGRSVGRSVGAAPPVEADTSVVTADSIAVDMGSDSVTITLPITQKVYRDSSYTAYVSGFDARLDSITIYDKTVTVTRREKSRRLKIGIQGGYGLTPAGMQPYIGIGFSYNFFR